MDKYVYCHEGNVYDDYTSLKKSEYKIFTALRTATGAGAFIYAPTTAGKAILFSYTQANGSSRVDGFKGDSSEISANPAAHIGYVRAEEPYHEQVTGALPVSRSFSGGAVNADRMAELVRHIVFGKPDTDVVLVGDDISRRAAEYLKFMYLLFSPEYARKIGFCINKFLKRDLDDVNKFSQSDEKPLIRIYALDSQKVYADCYKVNLDSCESVAATDDIGAKALTELIKRGVTKENFEAIYRETAGAFLPDGSLDVGKYVRCLVRAAYQNAYDLSYTAALMEYGFSSEHEKRLFVDCIARALRGGNESQKRLTADKAIELLGDDLGSVENPLMEYLVSQPAVSREAFEFLIRSAVGQLSNARGNDGEDGTLSLYLNAPSPSWKQKYAFITEVIQTLVGNGKILPANNVCKVLSERFSKEKLAYAKNISVPDLFSFGPNIGRDARDVICASLLKNDCGAGRIHSYARQYLKGNPTFGDLLRVRRKMIEIFDVDDFIFGDVECEKAVRARIAPLDIEKILEIYYDLSPQMTDYIAMKAEFYFAACNTGKLSAVDDSVAAMFQGFLTDAESELSDIGVKLGKTKEKDLAERVEECKTYIAETANANKAQANIDQFRGEFVKRLYEMLPKNEKNDIGEVEFYEISKGEDGEPNTKRSPAKADSYAKINGKYNEANNVGIYYNGTQGFGYGVALGALAGFISLLIMLIPAVLISAAVGDLSFATFSMYLSRYFYAAVVAPVFTVVMYVVLYKTLCAFFEDVGRARKAFGLTALCAFIPCLLCGLGYSLIFILLT